MTQTATIDNQAYCEPSLQKQLLYTKYAKGEMSRAEMAEEIAKIQPPIPERSWKQHLALGAVAFIIAAITPPWARRED